MALPILSRRLHGHVNYILPLDLKKRLDAKEEVVVLDLRSASDFKRAHIEGAKNIRPRQLADNLEAKLGSDGDLGENKSIVLVCQSDLSSIRTVKVFDRHGRNDLDVMVMKGGMYRWKRERLPVVKDN